MPTSKIVLPLQVYTHHVIVGLYARLRSLDNFEKYLIITFPVQSIHETSGQGWHSCASARHRPFIFFSGCTSFNLSLPLRVHMDAHVLTMD